MEGHRRHLEHGQVNGVAADTSFIVQNVSLVSLRDGLWLFAAVSTGQPMLLCPNERITLAHAIGKLQK